MLLRPLFFASAGLDVAQIGILAFTSPAVWECCSCGQEYCQTVWGRKGLIAGGMLLQGGALGIIAVVRGFWPCVGATTLLGAGTTMVYPTLLAAVGDVAHPGWRGSALGVYRLWRDRGYAAGALVAGALAHRFGMAGSIRAVAVVTFVSGLVVAIRMPDTLRSP